MLRQLGQKPICFAAHMPTLALVLKIAKALGVSAGDLMYCTEALLPPDYLAAES